MSREVTLGVSAYHGDASAALLVDGQLVAACEEERFRRVKHCAGFPSEAIRACLRIAGLSGSAVTQIAIARDPRAHFARKALFTLRHRPSLSLILDRARNARSVGDTTAALALALDVPATQLAGRVRAVEHHPAHLASAYFASPFEEAAVCAIDGFGDFVSTSIAHGQGNNLEVLDRTYFPHSLGMVYLAITQFLGFTRYGDEFKVMGLAPYGRAEHVAQIRELVRLRPRGRFELDLRYFVHASSGAPMTWADGEPQLSRVYSDKLAELLGPARDPAEPITPRHESIAASLQVVHEEAVFHVLREAAARTGSTRLALAGGCAMNSVANGKLRRETPFTEVYVQPAAADNGTSLGAALHVAHAGQQEAPPRFVMRHAYWGPVHDDAAIARAFEDAGVASTLLADDAELCDWAAERLAAGKILGWSQGRMEWGARALGNRSILADPRRADMRDLLNTKIKMREKFRPFAPSIAEDAVDAWFEGAVPDPFMLHVYPIRANQRALIPAVSHVDGTGRLQTVSAATNSLYWRLLKAFEKRTGVPILLNTSFNENEPIVNAPGEALDCYLRTRMDAIAIGRRVAERRVA